MSTETPEPDDDPIEPAPDTSLGNREAVVATLGAALVADGLILEFDGDAGSLTRANDQAKHALELPDEGLSVYSFQQLVSVEQDSNDLWWEIQAGTRTTFEGALIAVLSGSAQPMRLVAGQGPAGGVVLHATPAPATTSDASADGGSGMGQFGDYLAMIEYDPDGLVISANDRAEMALEFHGEPLVGRPHDTLLPPKVATSEDYISFWEKLREGRIVEGAFVHMTPQGDRVVLQSTYVPIKDEYGGIQRVTHFMMDVTEAERKAEENARRAEALWNGPPFARYDLEGHIEQMNPMMAKALGLPDDDVKGQPMSRYLNPVFSKGADFEQMWSKVLAGETVTAFVPHRTSNGTTFWTRSEFSPCMSDTGELEAVQEIAADVHDLYDAHASQTLRHEIILNDIALAEFDLSGKLITANASYVKAMGFDDEAMERVTHADTIPPDFRNNVRYKHFWEKLITGEKVSGEFRRIGLDDRQVWFKSSYVPLMNEDDAITERILFFAKDITDLKQRQLKAETDIVAFNKSLAVMEYDDTGKILTVNGDFAALLDRSIEEVVGQNYAALCRGEFAESKEFSQGWDKLLAGETIEREVPLVTKSGEDIWVHSHVNPIRDASGAIIRVIEFVLDVTTRKVEHRALSEKWSATGSAHAICEFDPDGSILSANDAFLRIIGHARRDITGNHHSMFCSPDVIASQGYRDFWLDLARGEAQDGVFAYVGRFGRDVHLKASFQPIRDINGEVANVVMLAADVTDYVNSDAHNRESRQAADEKLNAILSATSEIETAARQVETSLDDYKRAMNSGEQILDENLTDITGIGGDIERVSEIVDMLGEIAVQTNLLAFNAAIEAARAGEHGVGFSIVADEVRKLAERNAEAARNISRQIETAAGRVGRSEANTKKSISIVRETLEKMQAGDDTLRQISQRSQDQSEGITQVSHVLSGKDAEPTQ